MCFSAEASFTAAGLLIGSGLMASRISVNKNEKSLSQIPIIFGIQQAIEGALWILLANGEYNLLSKGLTISFLAIAWVVWPIFIPWIFLKFTTNPIFIKVNTSILILGLIVGTYNAYTFSLLTPYAQIDGNHILFRWYEYRQYGLFIGITYVICTLIPIFLTNNKQLMILGITHIIMFAFSYLFMIKYLISVWCFLAAVSSIIIYLILYANHKQRLK